jgi:GNAT superfamily N-acetyltransferase
MPSSRSTAPPAADTFTRAGHRVRFLDPSASGEIEQVAERMRATLVEVLGRERGTSLYDMDWLRARVRFHLDPRQSTGAVLLAEDRDGVVTGHTIVRIEREESAAAPFGLFSTTFVDPAWRRLAIASQLLAHGERWMLEHGVSMAVTYTASANDKLIALYEKHGYSIAASYEEMVRLAKGLPRAGAAR